VKKSMPSDRSDLLPGDIYGHNRDISVDGWCACGIDVFFHCRKLHYPPIKVYRYAGNTEKLFTDIKEHVGFDIDMHFKITDTTGVETLMSAIYIYFKVLTKIV
jgi:hypothetical protein